MELSSFPKMISILFLHLVSSSPTTHFHFIKSLIWPRLKSLHLHSLYRKAISQEIKQNDEINSQMTHRGTSVLGIISAVDELLRYYCLCENEQEPCPLCSEGSNANGETKHTQTKKLELCSSHQHIHNIKLY